MTKPTKNPVEQKAKLVAQLKEIESKIAQFDEARKKKIAALAEAYRLIDLSDAVLKKEFHDIRQKYNEKQDPTLAYMEVGKKNASAECEE